VYFSARPALNSLVRVRVRVRVRVKVRVRANPWWLGLGLELG